jgi:adenine phosphoribosyltransferase
MQSGGSHVSEAKLRAAIRDVPDFPKPGIVFKDITPVLADPELFRAALGAMEDRWKGQVDVIAGIESRGFLFGAPLADRMGCSYVPVRKAGKLPWKTRRVQYALEYGTDSLEIHEDAFAAGARVLIVDDLLATGGTAAATARLVEEAGGTVAGFTFLVSLSFLDGTKRIAGYPVQSLVEYE